MKVDFIVIGAHKAGSTSLAYYLAQHPNICFSSIKEPHFFTQTNPNIQTEEEYFKLFSPKPGQLLGEASINCTMTKRKPGTEERIHEHNPNTKLIYLLRDPIERIASAYRYRYVNNWTLKPLRDMEQEVLEGDYLAVSSYYSQVKPYLDFFPKENLFVCQSELMQENPQEFMRRLLGFLNLPFAEIYHTQEFFVAKKKTLDESGLNALGRIISGTHASKLAPRALVKWVKGLFRNKVSDIPPFSAAFRNTLLNKLEPDMKLLQQQLGADIKRWGF